MSSTPSYQPLIIDDSRRDTLLFERILRQSDEATSTVTGGVSEVDSVPQLP